MGTDNNHEEIWTLLGKINEAWLNARPGDLAPYFHKEMIMVAPGFHGRAEGRQACVASYREFVGQATIHDYEETGHAIDVWDDTAVLTYRFNISYQMGGETYDESGRDLFVFTHDGDRWLAVWRTMFPA